MMYLVLYVCICMSYDGVRRIVVVFVLSKKENASERYVEQDRIVGFQDPELLGEPERVRCKHKTTEEVDLGARLLVGVGERDSPSQQPTQHNSSDRIVFNSIASIFGETLAYLNTDDIVIILYGRCCV